MQELEIFKNEEFGQVRTININGRELFVGKDIAKCLGYSNPRDAISRHCKGVVKHDDFKEGGQRIALIPEGDVYRLITKSKLPSAEKFESWVFDEILPTIRKTGGYVANDDLFIDTYLPFADDNTKMLFKGTLETVRKQNELIKYQQDKIEEQQPMVDFVTTISESSDCIGIGKLAKLVKDEGIKLGRNKLFEWLRINKFLMKDNIPYQRYIDNSVFETKEYTYKTPYGTKIGFKCLVTPKGQLYIVEKLRKEIK
jgi:anti-repressor protein